MSPGSGDFSKHSTPMGGAPSGVQPALPGTPLLDSTRDGDNPFTFSMKGSSKMTVDLIREAALLTSNFTCPQKVGTEYCSLLDRFTRTHAMSVCFCQNQTTQTPDVWMTNVNGSTKYNKFCNLKILVSCVLSLA